MEETSALCERIAVLDHGKLPALGTEDEHLKLSGERTRIDLELTGGGVEEGFLGELKNLAVVETGYDDGVLTLFTGPGEPESDR